MQMQLNKVLGAKKDSKDWLLKPIGLRNSRLFIPLLITAGLFLVTAIYNVTRHELTFFDFLFNLVVPICGLMLLSRIALLVREDLYVPFIHIRNWALRMKRKEYTARLPVSKHSEFSKLAKDLNNLSEVLLSFSEEFQEKVKLQTSRIKEQNHSLNILYEVATTINESRNLDDLLSRFLSILVKLTDAKAGTVRLRTDDDQLKMVASFGLNREFVREECMVPINRCLCGTSFTQGSIEKHDSVDGCKELSGASLFSDKDMGILAVPLEYQGLHLGIFNIFLKKDQLDVNDNLKELLATIGKHLGMAIEKSRLTNEAKQHSVIKERTLLAHELHDSLAQTLASLRFQVTILEENMHEKISVSHEEIARLHESIDEAYREVRALITHFRAPIDNRGLIPALKKIINNFESNSNIPVFFQNEWLDQKLKSEHEFQIIRIVQESLTNIRKHSKARTVRLMIKSNPNRNEVLIEDDGVGIEKSNLVSSLGEHIGLSVMQERAQRLGGNLNIESEAGEGTQILLSFPNRRGSEQEVRFFH